MRLRFTKKFLLAFCFVLCFASAGWCFDPFKVNEGGFGPKIKGLQLGMKFTGDMPEKNIALREDGRIRRLAFEKEDFGAEAMTYRDFAKAIKNNYNIPELYWQGEIWMYRNDDEGWAIIVAGDYEVSRKRLASFSVVLEPLVIEPKFD